MTTLVTRDQMRPGQIVQRVTFDAWAESITYADRKARQA